MKRFSHPTYSNTFKLREPPKTCKIDVYTEEHKYTNMKACINCKTEYPEANYLYKKDSRTGNQVNSVQCKPCFQDKVCKNKRSYYEANRATFAEYNAKPENKERRNLRKKERKVKEPQFKTVESLKTRIHEVLRGYKNCSSSKLLDCTRTQLYTWLAYNFTDDMNWDNYGLYWHIDHVVPISRFNVLNTTEQNLCFNWSNLRPLKKEFNMSKSDKICEEYILTHIESYKSFCKIHQGYQTSVERCLWQRLELWNGKNPQGDVAFEEQLKWAIRSQVPKSVNDKDMEKVQRLNVSGLETSNQCQ